MRREKFGLSLSRFAQLTTAVLITLVLAGAARADDIQDLVVAGTAQNVSLGSLGSCAEETICSFSGTIMVDVTAGLVTAYNIIFPGLAAFDLLTFQGAVSSNIWAAGGPNGGGEFFSLEFTTTHTPASLVGFNGGSVVGFFVGGGGSGRGFYDVLGGTITPVPEPTSLALIGTGLFGLGGMMRRKLKRWATLNC